MAKAKEKITKYLKIAAVIAVLVAIVAGFVSVYDFGYKRGYTNGANNQLLCAAAQRDASLKSLCK